MKGKILLFLMILIILTSCTKTLPKIEFTELKTDCIIETRGDIVIQSIIQKEFWEKSGNCNIPDINFFNFNVLGKYIQGGGCSASFDKQVFVDDEKKIILYEITPNFEGLCKKIIQSNNWIIIPNMHDYTIKIDVKE